MWTKFIAMDSAYVEMAVPRCSSEVNQCDNGSESVSSPQLMHTLEPSLDMMSQNLEPDSGKDMLPPSTVPGMTQFATVEFSGFAQMSSEANEALACKSFSGTCSDSESGESRTQGSSTSAPAQVTCQSLFQTQQQENSNQYIQQPHALEQRPGSVSASPGPPSGSCGSPAPSTSLSHPSVGSPWSFDAGCLPGSSENPATASSLSTANVVSVSLLASQSADTLKPEKPQPPKKPLTPYMRFSKSIWQQVKAANPSLSVCEVGAAIGKLWREMIETEKQRHNEDFANDKVRYDDELQSYLRLTGLQASDLTKPKAKKKDTKDKSQTPLRPTKPQAAPFVAMEPTTSGTPAMTGERSSESLTIAVSSGFNGGANEALRAAGFQTVGVSGDCSGLGTNLGSLPHFSQVWTGQEVYANQQLLAQMGVAPGQTIFTNQTVGETPNASGLIAIQSQDVNHNEESQLATLYSGQGQPLQSLGNQMSVGQIDNSNVMTSSDNAWLWQQYNAGNQFVQDATAQSSLPQNHEGVVIYQLTSDGAQNSLLQSSSVESSLQTNQNLPNVMLAKSSSVAAANGTVETILEPGEVPLSGQIQVSASNGPIESGVYDLNQLCGLTPWNHVKDEKMGGFVQPVDGEKQLLRSALLEKSKEIQRLTRELELAYVLIHQLKQQNDLYQRHWNGQQQLQQQQLQQQQLQQQLQQQQHLQQQQQQLQQQQLQQQQLHSVPKTDATTGLSIST